MQPFDWTLLQSFLAVADHGSYSAAARETGRSQPTIGRHVDQLQQQLGAVLFRRATQGYALTPTGVALVEHARSMADSAARISLITEGRAEDVSGTVRITASEMVATYVLPFVIEDLLDQEPGLQIELVATNSTENLLRREADIAVRMVEPSQQDLIVRRIGEVALGFFAAPSYIDRHGVPQSMDDIANHRLLGYDRSDLILRGMRSFGIDANPELFSYRCDNQIAYFEALCAGVGLGAAQSVLARKRGLIAIFPDLPIPPLPAWLAAHAELRTSARVRRVFDHLVKTLPPMLG